MSKLENDLKAIIRTHPGTDVHPHSPSGPYVRAVLWTAVTNDRILGQVFWDTSHDRWVVRAVDTTVGDASLVVFNPAARNEIPDAITEVIERVQDPLQALSALAPSLTDVIRSLRGRV